jgi:hypothetical protein
MSLVMLKLPLLARLQYSERMFASGTVHPDRAVMNAGAPPRA